MAVWRWTLGGMALFLAAGAAAGSGPAHPALRIGAPSAVDASCAPGTQAPSAGERAYFAHLSARLERSVLRCPVADPAAAFADGRIDMAVLDAPAFAAAQGAARATLTARAEGALTRVPIVLAVRRENAALDLAGRTVVFGGTAAAGLARPRQVLGEQGLAEQVRGPDVVAANETQALEWLRAGRADALALHAGAWQRQCRGSRPGEDRCRDLKVLWRARPKADRAWAVRSDMPTQLRFRIVGVHVALHLENPAAFAWAADQLSADVANLEPAEALALTTARLP